MNRYPSFRKLVCISILQKGLGKQLLPRSPALCLATRGHLFKMPAFLADTISQYQPVNLIIFFLFSTVNPVN